VLDGVRGREHVEGSGQGSGGALDGHLAFLHRLEQRGLRLRRGAVDLVGQQQTREHGAGPEREVAGALVEHLGTREVRGQQVRGELGAGERQSECLGE
jgi:hypothetical protein